MKRNNTLYLIQEIQTQDEKGVWHTTEKKRKVYCAIRSVGQREWFEGGRNGLNPQMQATMFLYDYNGENIAECNNKRYSIYRTYENSSADEIELYLEFKKGTADG